MFFDVATVDGERIEIGQSMLKDQNGVEVHQLRAQYFRLECSNNHNKQLVDRRTFVRQRNQPSLVPP